MTTGASVDVNFSNVRKNNKCFITASIKGTVETKLKINVPLKST